MCKVLDASPSTTLCWWWWFMKENYVCMGKWLDSTGNMCLSPYDWKRIFKTFQVRIWMYKGFLSGSASQLLRTYFPDGMSETLIRTILFGAVQGLNYLHQNGCIHRYLLVHIPYKLKNLNRSTQGDLTWVLIARSVWVVLAQQSIYKFPSPVLFQDLGFHCRLILVDLFAAVSISLAFGAVPLVFQQHSSWGFQTDCIQIKICFTLPDYWLCHC